MWNWILNILNSIWKWIKSFFTGKKDNPIVKITILTIFFTLFIFVNQGFSDRLYLQYLNAIFEQPDIENVESWTVFWNSDSLNVAKTDSLVTIENDTTVTVKVDTLFDYDTEYMFWVVARNSVGSSSSDTVKVYFMRSDLNNDNNVDGLDLIELNKKWGWTGLQYRDFEDINGDGVVDGLDLIEMNKDWGRSYIP